MKKKTYISPEASKLNVTSWSPVLAGHSNDWADAKPDVPGNTDEESEKPDSWGNLWE